MFAHRLVRFGLVAVVVVIVAGCATWTSQSVPNGTPPLSAVSCPTVIRCVAVGNNVILTTRNGGGSWSSQPVPSGANVLASVSCPTITHCVAMGGGFDGVEQRGPEAILTTSDGGRTWVSRPLPSGASDQLQGVSCPSVTHCVAVGGSLNVNYVTTGDVMTTNDGGATWMNQALPGPALSSVSCASTSACVAVGVGVDSVITTTDGGATWVGRNQPEPLLAVSCPSTSTCVAGGVTPNALETTTDGGTTWVDQTPPPSTLGGVAGISCASTITCVAVVGNNSFSTTPAGAIFATTNGGATWTSQTVPDGVGLLSGVSCPTPISCIVVGENQQGGGTILRTG